MIKYCVSLLFFFFCAVGSQAQYRSLKLYKKVTKYDKNEEYEKVLKAEKDIISYAKNRNDTTASALFFVLGVNHLYYGDLTKANFFIEEAIKIKDSTRWHSKGERFDQLYYLAASEWYLEKYEKADSTFLLLINFGHTIYSSGADDLLYVYKEYAAFLEEQGKLIKADSVLTYAILNGKGNQYSLPSLQSYQALIANELGDYQRAKKLYYISLEGLEKIKDEYPVAFASSLSNLGNLYYDLGQYPVSEQMQTKALYEFNKAGLGESEDAMSVMHNLAYTSNELGLQRKALNIYKKIIHIEESTQKDKIKYALTLNNLGIVYHDIKKYDTAIFYFNKALKIFLKERGIQNPDYAITLNNKAKTFLYLEQYDSAVNNSLRALKIIEKEFDKTNPEIAIYQHTLGLIYYAIGNYNKAVFYLTESLRLRRDKLGKLNPKYAESAFEMAKLMWALNKPEDANIYFSSAFESYLNQIKVFFPTMSEYERTKFFTEKIKPSVEIFYSYALANPTDLLLEELIYYRLQTKGLLYYSSSNVKRSILSSGDTTLIENYNIWLKKRDSLAKLIQNNKPTEEINELWVEVNDLEKTISEASSSFSSASKPLFLSDIKDHLEPEETAIEIIRYNSYSPFNGGQVNDTINYAAIIITSKDSIEMVMINNGVSLESKYLYYYSNVIKYLRPDLHSYNKYWKPIEEKLDSSKTIYISTDGVYNHININILLDVLSNSYVLETKNIIPLTSLADISQRESTVANVNPSYFFGYPSYDSLPVGENEIASSIDDKISKTENNASFQIVSSSLYANLISNRLFQPLPGTLIEIEEIKEIYKASNSPIKVFLKEQVTEAELKKVQAPTVLHIATHGFFLPLMLNSSENQPTKSSPLLKSGLVLAGAESLQKSPGLSSENGVLTAYEAMNLNLTNTQLVVMSACETGLGIISNGEGVYGLQRAFQIAGAESVVMSMWTVNDTATQQLMRLFYTNWLNGQEKHEAFRNAQLELKKTFDKPYYWGAFIMNGL